MRIRFNKLSFVFFSSLLLLTLLTTGRSYAQNLSASAKLTPSLTDLFNGMPFVKPNHEVVGETYLINEWKPVSILLASFDKEITGYSAKYDLFAFELHFKINDRVRALDEKELNSFTIFGNVPRYFVSAKKFKKKGTPLIGFFEVLAPGQFPVLKYHFLEIRKPNYQAVLNAGSRNTIIFKKSELYTAKDGNLVKIKDRRELHTLFGSKSDEVTRFIKINTLSLDIEADVLRIFAHVNELK